MKQTSAGAALTSTDAEERAKVACHSTEADNEDNIASVPVSAIHLDPATPNPAAAEREDDTVGAKMVCAAIAAAAAPVVVEQGDGDEIQGETAAVVAVKQQSPHPILVPGAPAPAVAVAAVAATVWLHRPTNGRMVAARVCLRSLRTSSCAPTNKWWRRRAGSEPGRSGSSHSFFVDGYIPVQVGIPWHIYIFDLFE